jgi:hypothetical protein
MSLYMLTFPRDRGVLNGLPYSLNEVEVFLTGVWEKVTVKDPAGTLVVTGYCDVARGDIVEGTDAGDHKSDCI